jgi:cytoskeletal protein CcmA (bactofilin family)
MTVEKKTIRSDIPGHQSMMSAGLSGYASPQDEGRRLTVGRDITLNGDIASCDHLVVEGTVQAQAFQARRIDVLESGYFAGSAEVQDAIVAGRVEGKIKVHGRLIVKATGRVYGEIEYGTLEAEAGSRIEGQLLVLSPVAAEVAQPIAIVQTNDNSEATTASSEETSEERPKVFRRAIGY